MQKCYVFVTVGTTNFDDLIAVVTSDKLLDTFIDKGYSKLIVQAGNSKSIASIVDDKRIEAEIYKYKDSIEEDIQNASLVISHAGAGSILEALALKKKLVVVVNETLMDNHQYELAEKMAELGYLFFCTCDKLNDILIKNDLKDLKEKSNLETGIFANFVDKFMGI